MSKHYTGGCACGAIRYDIAAEPVASVDCQCRQCQRVTGSGHGSYLTFAGADLNLQGQPGTWDMVGDGGTVKRGTFCATCGSPVFIAFPTMPDVVAVHAGSLDDPSPYKPQFVTWHSSANAWDFLDPAVPTFEKMPPG